MKSHLAAGSSVLLLATFCSVAHSQAPFTVLRSTDPATLSAEPAHATVTAGPFDDDPGTLHDGESYFYLVRDATDTDLTLSAQASSALGTVRIGFDDGDPGSAPVDASNSTVTAAPFSFAADGATMAIVSVVPMDVAAMPLGAGLDVVVDAVALQPGIPAGPFVDHADGSYSMAVVSSTAGSGTVVVTVEGVALSTQPALTYELVGPSVCGDGYVDTSTGEQCDDANASNTDACLDSCLAATCGDGFVHEGVEECDGGVDCNPDCTRITCENTADPAICSDELLVIIGEIQTWVDTDPGSPYSHDLDRANANLNKASGALAATPPRPSKAVLEIDKALDHVDDALDAGLDPQVGGDWVARLLAIRSAIQGS